MLCCVVVFLAIKMINDNEQTNNDNIYRNLYINISNELVLPIISIYYSNGFKFKYCNFSKSSQNLCKDGVKELRLLPDTRGLK